MIQGKVAAILNERQLVINRGSEHGVDEGMEFAVLEPRVVEVIDPETSESLGQIEIEKVRVQVVTVEPKLSIAQTFEDPGRLGSFRTYMDVFGGKPGALRTLRASDAIFKPLPESESLVKRGDVVREVEAEGS